MSEFMEKHSVARLIGAPPGYVGYEEGGYLTEAVRRRPYSLILLDEIEKAHGDIFNILLQVLDDGRLTDGQGRTVDFRQSMIVMTSNLGSSIIQDLQGESEVDIKMAVMEVVTQSFRPEFLNRIDESVVFHQLSEKHIVDIAKVQLQSLISRLASQSMTLSVSDQAVEYIAKMGFDATYGARPLQRTIQSLVENPLSEAILSGSYQSGCDIHLDVRDGQIIFD